MLLTLIPVIAVVAPAESRWLAAAGFETFYDTFQESAPTPTGPARTPGLSADQTEKALQNVDPNRTWQVGLMPEPPTEFSRFAHERPDAQQVINFEEQTSDLALEPFDLLATATAVRALTTHKDDVTSDDIRENLLAARSGRGLICQHFARLFGSVCSCRGYTTRTVSLSATGDDFDHALCEVFDPEHSAWVAVDVDLSIAYRRDGKLLSAIEVQDSWRKLRDQIGLGLDLGNDKRAMSPEQIFKLTGTEVVCFASEIEPDLRDERMQSSRSGMNLELFEFVFLAMRDDYLSMDYPVGHPARVRQLCFRADGLQDISPVCPEAIFVARESAYAPVSWCSLSVTGVDVGPTVDLQFGTRTPHFLVFEYSVDGSEWQAVGSPTRTWQLHSGTNEFRLRSVNFAGVRSEITRLQIDGETN